MALSEKTKAAWRPFVVGFILGGLACLVGAALIPLTTSSGRDARQSEGEQMIGAFKGVARVNYGQSGRHFDRLVLKPEESSHAKYGELDGKYYRVVNVVGTPSAGSGEIFAVPQDNHHSTIRMWFSYGGGDGKVEYLGPDRSP